LGGVKIKIQKKKINISKLKIFLTWLHKYVSEIKNCDLCLKGNPGPAGSPGPEGPAVCIIFNILK